MSALNAASAPEFVAALGGIFEHSPWVAQRAHALRPFESRKQLLEAMCAVVDGASDAEQLALIREHPQLGLRGRAQAQLTVASSQEQRRAGLDACTAEELRRLTDLNAAYGEKFAMPFILAVRGHTPASIIANVAARLANDRSVEERTALREIGKIAGYRLAAVIVE